VSNEGKVFTDRRSVGVADASDPNGSVHFHPLCGERHDRRLPCVHPVQPDDVCHCGEKSVYHPKWGPWECREFRRAQRAKAS
jgi:hypothetical protein